MARRGREIEKGGMVRRGREWGEGRGPHVNLRLF